VHKPPVVVLPHTGATLPVDQAVGGAIALLGLGLLLLVASGRRRPSWMPRR
jgi:LPXTG-motif cell wall-anchored protein